MKEFLIVERAYFLDNAPIEVGHFSSYEEAFDFISKDREEIGGGYIWEVRHIADTAKDWELIKIEWVRKVVFGWVADVGFSNGYGELRVMWLNGKSYLTNSNNYSKPGDMREWEGISRELFQALCKERGIAMPFEL